MSNGNSKQKKKKHEPRIRTLKITKFKKLKKVDHIKIIAHFVA